MSLSLACAVSFLLGHKSIEQPSNLILFFIFFITSSSHQPFPLFVKIEKSILCICYMEVSFDICVYKFE